MSCQHCRGTGVRRRSVLIELLAAFLTLLGFWAMISAKYSNSLYTYADALHDYADAHLPSSVVSIPSSLLSSQPLEPAVLDLSHLHAFNLTNDFTYARREVVTQRVQELHPRPLLTSVDTPLYNKPIKVNVDGDLSQVNLEMYPPLTLQVPTPRAANANTLLFGISTTIPRLQDSIPQFQHWLANSGARLHVVVPDHPEIKTTQVKMTELGILVDIQKSHEPFARAYFTHLKTLFKQKDPNVQWISLIDDDTFFPSLPDVLAHLHTDYDYRRPTIVAPMSDDFAQITKHGIMPFGGGGMFLSLPLVEQLVRPDTMAKCLDTDRYEGDQILSQCLLQHTLVKPSFDYDLHQMDMKGDVSGFYESGRSPLSLHHFKSWHEVDLTSVALSSKACGNNCMLQRWQFADSAVLSNGYSIVRYPALARNAINFQAMEMTWNGEMDRFLHTHSPLRPALAQDKDKFTLLLIHAVETDTHVRQTYAHRSKKQADTYDEVLELVWRK